MPGAGTPIYAIADGVVRFDILTARMSRIEVRGDAVIWILLATAAAYMVITLPMGYFVGVLERKVAIAR